MFADFLFFFLGYVICLTSDISEVPLSLKQYQMSDYNQVFKVMLLRFQSFLCHLLAINPGYVI